MPQLFLHEHAGPAAAETAGVDEAGRGCLAGPVVAAAVILPDSFDLPGLNDSKVLSELARETLAPRIRAQALAWAVALARPREIDAVNILQATFLAMSRAVRRLRLRPRLLLVDGDKTIPPHLLDDAPAQRAKVGGDARFAAISAASILAKTTRDHMLAALDRRFPGYGLAEHKGYGTAVHREALLRLGPCPAHRLTFRGVLPDEQRKGATCPQARLPI
ncbi:ribonuclease HII [Desulfovibrio aminophilus]|nr:ribonuclease HII [Desulfovibrio aminophilus]MCM0754709.1 ribonuclease HII [Desulfovibrio aminophilus]